MSVSYDIFYGAFLSKIAEYELVHLDEGVRNELVDRYMKRSLGMSVFTKVCKYDFISNADDVGRTFSVDVPENEIDEIADIVSEGMVVQWLKPYVYQQENLQNILNTRDYSMYSPAELLLRVGGAYAKAQKDHIQMIREYSYNHGDLSTLHI